MVVSLDWFEENKEQIRKNAEKELKVYGSGRITDKMRVDALTKFVKEAAKLVKESDDFESGKFRQYFQIEGSAFGYDDFGHFIPWMEYTGGTFSKLDYKTEQNLSGIYTIGFSAGEGLDYELSEKDLTVESDDKNFIVELLVMGEENKRYFSATGNTEKYDNKSSRIFSIFDVEPSTDIDEIAKLMFGEREYTKFEIKDAVKEYSGADLDPYKWTGNNCLYMAVNHAAVFCSADPSVNSIRFGQYEIVAE
ncbi:MAG: hypothetical protein GOV01_01030 [Candidatus Altiarchaeota archaeon]|nr:hypothetical protein [Candidatus Altiarchaeota archaeon]